MIEAKEIYQIVGLTFIVIIILAFGLKMFKFQSSVIEGMTTSTTDKDKISSSVSSNTDKISDTLLVSKYRSDYEDTIINLEKAVSLGLLSEVVNNAETISSDPTSTASIKAISNMNKLKAFRETLNQSMIILDKSK